MGPDIILNHLPALPPTGSLELPSAAGTQLALLVAVVAVLEPHQLHQEPSAHQDDRWDKFAVSGTYRRQKLGTALN